MASRLKEGLSFSISCYLLIVALNTIAWLIIEFVPFLFHNGGGFFELQGAVLLFYIPLIFICSLLLRRAKVFIYFPILYLLLSILILIPDSIEGWDLMFLLNFGFSQISYVGYVAAKEVGAVQNEVMEVIIFNGIFFVYQMGILYYSNKILSKFNKMRTIQ